MCKAFIICTLPNGYDTLRAQYISSMPCLLQTIELHALFITYPKLLIVKTISGR